MLVLVTVLAAMTLLVLVTVLAAMTLLVLVALRATNCSNGYLQVAAEWENAAPSCQFQVNSLARRVAETHHQD